MVQAVEFLRPTLPCGFDLAGIRRLIAVQRLQQSRQGTLCVGNDRHGVQFQRLEFGDVDVDEFRSVLKEPLGGSGEVGVARPDTDDDVRFLRDLIGRRAARHADAAEVQRMVVEDGTLARLGLAERDPRRFGKGPELLVRFAVADASAADKKRLLRRADHFGRLSDRFRFGQPPCEPPDTLCKEGFGIVIGFALDILRDRDADRAGVCRIGQGAEGRDHCAHQLLGAHDAVPVTADRPEGVVGRDRQIVHLLDLLQHRVRLAAGVDVAGQDQDRDIVRGRGRGCGDHVGGAGADGGRHGNDLLALHLLGKGHGGVRHALFVFALPDFETAGLLPERLAEADHVAVARQHDHAFDKGIFLPVIGDVLIFQKTDQGLCHGQADCLHISLLFCGISLGKCVRWHRLSRAIHVLFRRCGSSATGRRPDGGCPRNSTWRSRAPLPGSACLR